MPLLGNGEYREPLPFSETLTDSKELGLRTLLPRKQSQHSATARIAMNNMSNPAGDGANTPEEGCQAQKEPDQSSKSPSLYGLDGNLAAPSSSIRGGLSNGVALTDTPLTTAPNSPTM